MSVFGLKIEYGIGQTNGPPSLQSFEVALERFGANIDNFEKFVFPRVVDLFEKTVDGQFVARGGGPRGPWKPLKENYAHWKSLAFPGKPLLELTGALREGLTKSSSAFAAREYGANSFVFGTKSVPYASYHQTGTKTGLAVRPVFDFPDNFDDNLRGALQLGVVDAARDAQVSLESDAENAHWAKAKAGK